MDLHSKTSLFTGFIYSGRGCENTIQLISDMQNPKLTKVKFPLILMIWVFRTVLGLGQIAIPINLTSHIPLQATTKRSVTTYYSVPVTYISRGHVELVFRGSVNL